MNAVERHLISDRDGIIRLLAPPFDRTSCDPGYIKGYVPGVRENGGQYTHAALWVVRALVGLGRNERAAQLLEMLSPVCHARTEPEVARYQVEPYVVAADVYGEPPHVGRGGWTWYTGSAGWMLRVALESLLGVTIENGRTLVVRPGVPKTWHGYRVTLRPPGCDGSYSVEVSNPSGLGSEVSEAYLDDFPIPFADGGIEVPLVSDGKAHRVRLILGSASGIAAPGAFSDTKA
jgi:cyclic beta-1,2-glucan synthetase